MIIKLTYLIKYDTKMIYRSFVGVQKWILFAFYVLKVRIVFEIIALRYNPVHSE